MALAISFEKLVKAGEVADYAELARLGHVTRARVTQIMNLLLLAPDIQEELLFLPRIEKGRDRLHVKLLLPIAATTDGQSSELAGQLRQQRREILDELMSNQTDTSLRWTGKRTCRRIRCRPFPYGPLSSCLVDVSAAAAASRNPRAKPHHF